MKNIDENDELQRMKTLASIQNIQIETTAAGDTIK